MGVKYRYMRDSMGWGECLRCGEYEEVNGDGFCFECWRKPFRWFFRIRGRLMLKH